MRSRILVTNWVHDEVLARLHALGDVDANPGREPWAPDEVRRRAQHCDAIMAFMTDTIDRTFLVTAPRLKLVACALKGFDNFDVEACSEAGVWISIVPDLLTGPTAELAVGLAIGLGRHIRHGDGVVRSGSFEGWRPSLYGSGLDDATVAIVGMGRVGRAIARRLSGFGCRLLGVDPDASCPPGIDAVGLDEALPRADFVIVAAPLTAQSYHLIGEPELAAMKRSALLINIGRGSTVNEAAVARALDAELLGGYAADVFELEDWALPDRPRRIDPRLLASPGTLFTPHLGSAVDSVRIAIALRCADNIEDVLTGRAPRDAINAPVRPATARAV